MGAAKPQTRHEARAKSPSLSVSRVGMVVSAPLRMMSGPGKPAGADSRSSRPNSLRTSAAVLRLPGEVSTAIRAGSVAKSPDDPQRSPVKPRRFSCSGNRSRHRTSLKTRSPPLGGGGLCHPEGRVRQSSELTLPTIEADRNLDFSGASGCRCCPQGTRRRASLNGEALRRERPGDRHVEDRRHRARAADAQRGLRQGPNQLRPSTSARTPGCGPGKRKSGRGCEGQGRGAPRGPRGGCSRPPGCQVPAKAETPPGAVLGPAQGHLCLSSAPDPPRPCPCDSIRRRGLAYGGMLPPAIAQDVHGWSGGCSHASSHGNTCTTAPAGRATPRSPTRPGASERWAQGDDPARRARGARLPSSIARGPGGRTTRTSSASSTPTGSPGSRSAPSGREAGRAPRSA